MIILYDCFIVFRVFSDFVLNIWNRNGQCRLKNVIDRFVFADFWVFAMYKPVLGSQILEKLLKIFVVCDIILAYNIKKSKKWYLPVVCRSFAAQNCPGLCIQRGVIRQILFYRLYTAVSLRKTVRVFVYSVKKSD